MSEAKSRRLFLQTFFSSAIGLTFAPVMIGSCRSKTNKTEGENKGGTASDPCSDYSELSKADIKTRESLGYVQKAPSIYKQCGNCNLWLPAAGQACGKCQLFKGPVPASANCTYWAPRIE